MTLTFELDINSVNVIVKYLGQTSFSYLKVQRLFFGLTQTDRQTHTHTLALPGPVVTKYK